MSVGAELSYRQNMPLASDPVQVLPAAFVPLVPGSIATTAVPTSGTPGALGDTMHGVLNAVNIFPSTPLFDTAVLAGELTWMQWLKVTQNEAVFKGRSNYTQIDKVVEELRRSRDQLHADVVPGLSGRRPACTDHLEPGHFGQRGRPVRRQRGRRQLERRRRRRHLPEVPDRSQVQRLLRRLFDDPDRRHAQGGVLGVPNGANASLSDRGWVSLTLKTTF